MKRVCLAAICLFPLAGMAAAQVATPGAKITEETLIDAINAELGAAAAEEVAMKKRLKKNGEERAAGCELQGAMVQDVVGRKENGETLEEVQAVIAADPAYDLLPHREFLTMWVDMAFNSMGGMKPEDANAFAVTQCMKT